MLVNTDSMIIESIRNDYNSAIEKMPDYSEFNTELQSQKRAEYIQKQIDKTGIRLNSTEEIISTDKQKVISKLNEIKYPALSSQDMNSKIIGEHQKSSAIEFMNKPRGADRILASIKESLSLNRIDFAVHILDELEFQYPKDSAAEMELRKNPEKFYLLNETRKIYENFKAKSGLNEVLTELNEFEKLEKRISNFKMLLKAKEKFIFFPEDYNKMNEPERKKINHFVDKLPLQNGLMIKRIMQSSLNNQGQI